MLPAPDGQERAGIVSDDVYPTAAEAREAREALRKAARPGTQLLRLTVEPVLAEGPTSTLSGIIGHRLVSRGARPVGVVVRQIAALHDAAVLLPFDAPRRFSA